MNTTPESLDLLRLFTELEQAGGTHATMEVSSHALDLGRVYGLQFHTVVFTNLTRDHLDFHQTMEAYFAAKQRLFAGAGGPPPRFAVLNRDDQYAAADQAAPETEVLWYGLGPEAESARAPHLFQLSGTALRRAIRQAALRRGIAADRKSTSTIFSRPAARDSLMASRRDVIARGIAALQAVPGRFERVDEGQPFVWWWTMRTPTTPCAIPSRWRAG